MMNKTIEIISSDILKNKTLSDKKTYVIEGEVRVRKGVKLTIRDKVTILLVNGVFSKSVVRRSTLIFAQGSTLSAKRVYIKACTVQHKPVKHADNGGVWFLGNYKDASKDKVSVKTNRKIGLSRFNCKLSDDALPRAQRHLPQCQDGSRIRHR
jgi:hypothetical protein